MLRSVITGTGAYIPPEIQANSQFENQVFYGENQQPLPTASKEIVDKFKAITGIEERRYTSDASKSSDIGAIAAKNAIDDSGINMEEIDQLIVAHNFGDVIKNTIQSDAVPSLASRIKNILGIKNPNCVAYDILFGCPGWIQGMIQADAFFKAGIASKTLIIGAETLSRVIDKYDRDSMIFSDGAGAAIIEYKETGENGAGILSASVQTHTIDECDYINMGPSYNPDADPGIFYIKMKGRKVYEYAMKHVPAAMKMCLDKSGADIGQLKKVFIHQANAKMDEGIIKRFYQLYNLEQHPENIMPMCIQWLGNSSVATVPTLYDLVRKGKIKEHELKEGDIIMFASVGAGMNINAVTYRY
ncbi:MAG: 3-oxoacyl-ACP synthase III family protein [Gloeobacteraceae cyanobacterium ES-bin-316]|nr:3-oxoacyl-ACP synthase III family protein [Ferruginibacter sp.]